MWQQFVAIFWGAFFDAAFKNLPAFLEALPKILDVWHAAQQRTLEDARQAPKEVVDEVAQRIADSQH